MHRPLHALLCQRLQTPDIRLRPVGGGSINQTYKITTPSNHFFCKFNSATKFPHLFQQEMLGLELLGKQGHLKTPALVDYFVEADQQVLILEWIEEVERTDSFWKTFGAGLAALHQARGSHFGLEQDNYMGSIPQSNTPAANWVSFFSEQRLQPLVKQCAAQNLLDAKTQQLFECLYLKLPALFEEEAPCLLHGDLWS